MTSGAPSNSSVESLRFAVRLSVLSRRLGQLFLPLAALTTVPLVVSLGYGQHSVALRYLVVVAGLVAVGLLTRKLPNPDAIQPNEAMAVTALVFCIAGLVMSYPMMGYGLTFEDALFEAVSGVTTTGLTTLGSVEDRPPAFLFARAWLQWVGGLGVVVLALALLIQPGVAAKRLGFDEREKDPIVGGTRAHARRVLAIYSILTATGVGLLLAVGAAPLDALVHALAAVSTGGFSNSDRSLAELGTPLQACVLLVSLSGAISFSWYYSGSFRRLSVLLRDVQIRTLLTAILLVTALLFAFSRAGGDSLGSSLENALLMATSAQTTTGFATTSVAEMSAASKLVLAVSMLAGGEIGSTAGGIKIFRLLILLRLMTLTVLRASIQRGGQLPVQVGDDAIDSSEIESAVGLCLSYVAVLSVVWLTFVGFGYAPVDALFDVSSALATAGLSTGIVGPELQPGLKMLLVAVMLLGRVEACAFLLLLYPGTWIGKKRSTA